MIDPRWQSPLEHRTPLRAGDVIAIRERPFPAYAILRGHADLIASSVHRATGLTLPSAVGETVGDDTLACTWLGPDEWVFVAAAGSAASWFDTLVTELGVVHHQLLDVSDQYATIEVVGLQARDLLSKLIEVDLHPRALASGTGLATALAKANIWVWLFDDEPGGPDRFRITTRCSFADYVWCLLADAGREWGLPAQDPIGRVKLHLPHFDVTS